MTGHENRKGESPNSGYPPQPPPPSLLWGGGWLLLSINLESNVKIYSPFARHPGPVPCEEYGNTLLFMVPFFFLDSPFAPTAALFSKINTFRRLNVYCTSKFCIHFGSFRFGFRYVEIENTCGLPCALRATPNPNLGQPKSCFRIWRT